MNVEARPWCTEARKGAFVGDIHEAVLLKERLRDIGKIGLLMDIAVPVQATEKRLTGVLAAHLMADWLIDAMDLSFGPIETAVVTSQGHLVTKAGLIATGGPPTRRSLEQSALAEASWPDGTFYHVAVLTRGSGDFPGFGWIAVARIPKDQVKAAPLFWIALGGVACSLLLYGLGVLLASEDARQPS
jgi:hypothetical protein